MKSTVIRLGEQNETVTLGPSSTLLNLSYPFLDVEMRKVGSHQLKPMPF